NKPAMWAMRLDESRRRVPLPGPEFSASNGRISPDGRWMAFVSSEAGRPEIYVRPFLSAGRAIPALGEGTWQVSREGADRSTPRWRGDGKELFFMDANDVIEAVDV